VLAPHAVVTLMTDRRVRGPWGLGGGGDGAPGRDLIDGEHVPSKVVRHVEGAARVRIETPGGGGWGAVTDERD
jgi:N-methylhydantoinase B